MSAAQYDELKREILARVGLSPICAAQYFHYWEYKPYVPARAQAAKLSQLAQHWLLDGDLMATQIAERLVIDRLLRAIPQTHRQAVGMRKPEAMEQLRTTVFNLQTDRLDERFNQTLKCGDMWRQKTSGIGTLCCPMSFLVYWRFLSRPLALLHSSSSLAGNCEDLDRTWCWRKPAP